MTMADGKRAPDPPARDADPEQDGGHRDRQEQQDAVDDAPSHRSEDPLPDRQGEPDDEQEDREDDEDESKRAERNKTTDLTGDRARFGLGQVDVSHDEGAQGVARDARAGPASQGGLPRGLPDPADPPGGGGGWDGGVLVGSSRVLLRIRLWPWGTRR